MRRTLLALVLCACGSTSSAPTPPPAAAPSTPALFDECNPPETRGAVSQYACGALLLVVSTEKPRDTSFAFFDEAASNLRGDTALTVDVERGEDRVVGGRTVRSVTLVRHDEDSRFMNHWVVSWDETGGSTVMCAGPESPEHRKWCAEAAQHAALHGVPARP